MTDFNFLRIKWPKLAAMAADAGRLVEVSPASAINGMQSFCEWAADIALDFYEISAQTGITQQEKLDTLKATGHVPSDILQRFHDIMMAGGRRLYRQNEDVEEARTCIDDVYEIGRWLNKEADRVGWPPKAEYYRPAVSSLGSQGEGGAFSAGRLGAIFNNYRYPILFAGVITLIIIGAIWGITSVLKDQQTSGKKTDPVLTPTPSVATTPQLVTNSADLSTPTPPPESVTYLDKMDYTSAYKDWIFPGKWHFAKSGDVTFSIGDKQYFNGFGIFVPAAKITGDSSTRSMAFKLNGAYDKLRFDLGIDSGLQYGSGHGYFRIVITADSKEIYNSGKKEYDFTDLAVEKDITGCSTLTIKLTEWKGTKSGTLNVVLGRLCVVKTGVASADDTSDSSSPGASASPDDADVSPSPTISDDGGANQKVDTSLAP